MKKTMNAMEAAAEWGLKGNFNTQGQFSVFTREGILVALIENNGDILYKSEGFNTSIEQIAATFEAFKNEGAVSFSNNVSGNVAS